MKWLRKFEHGFNQKWDGAFIDERDFHFHRRLLERYSIVLGPGDYGAMKRSIARGKAKVLGGHRGESIYAVRVPSCGALILVAFVNGKMRTAIPINKQTAQRFKALVGTSASSDPSP